MKPFKKVYGENKEFVLRTISKYTDNEQDREDVFQEVFININRSLKGFKGDSDIKTWIYKISVNTAINHLKRRKMTENITGAIKAALPFLKSYHEEPDVAVEIGELRFLKVLDPKQKAVLIMSEVDELKMSEIAKVLNIPQGTVKSTLNRAKEKVRKYFREENIDGNI